MLLKARTESKELLVLRSLNSRLELSEKEKLHYLNLEKGYEGEVKMDFLLEQQLSEERFIINDLLLNVNNAFFQIDTVLISQGVIHLLDVKNYEGDFYIDEDKLYAVSSGWEYKNPLIQLKRSETLFRQLLQKLKLHYLVESTAVFINPEFTLYQAPMNQSFILPTQVNRFLREMNSSHSKLNEGHKNLANKLLSLHQTKNPYTHLPQYKYEDLQKGVYCQKCKSYVIDMRRGYLICRKCEEMESIEKAILRLIAEFQLLFPERKLTTRGIFDWCHLDLSTKTFNRILNKHFEMIGNKRNAYFVEKQTTR